jgi:nitrite reductase/ring-hydroxylating ferredoxin subunit
VKKVLCAFNDLADGAAIAVDIDAPTGGFSLVLTQVNEIIRAFYNECPHAGRRLDWAPGKFLIENNQLICAAHGATFSMDSGECVSGPCRGSALRSVEIHVENGQVLLDFP